MLIRRRDLDEGHVQREPAAAEQAGDLREETGGEIGPTLLDGPTDVVADEEGVDADVPLHAGGHIIRGAHGEDLHDLHVLQLRGVFHQGG
jgi:hypothetical protein